MTGETPDPPAGADGESERKAWWVTHRWYLYSGTAALLLVALLGLIIFLRENAPLEFDTEWMDEIIENRQPLWEVLALVMDFLGGGWLAFVIPVLVAIALLLARHRWGALYFAIASAATFVATQALKNIFDRPRPEDILIVIDSGSFPSGHTSNAATIAVALGIIFRKTWVWVLGAAYVVLMAVSRTYLGAHWVSDTMGGLLVGAAIAVIVWAPLAYRLNHERHERKATGSAL